MSQRRVLFLDNSLLSVFKVGGGKVQPEGTFLADEAGMLALRDYLGKHRSSLFMLLADVAEEGFQLEDIPYCSGKDRAAIVKRKLGQYFYGTWFTLALTQGRLKTGRRDERLLMMALTHPQHFEPVLAILREGKVILSGIYSLPQITPLLLPKMASQQQLLLTQTHGGLRQTFFVDQKLRFSRLTPLATGSAEESAIATLLEAGKMHQYLASQRLIERNKPLATRVLLHPDQMSAMRERCRDTAELRFEFADLPGESRQAGLNSPQTGSHAELLFCHLLVKNPPTEQFAPATERQFYRLWQIRFLIKGVSAVILIAGLLFTAKHGIDIMRTQGEVDQLQRQTRLDQQRYDAILQALPKIPLSNDDLRALVGRYEQVAKRAQGPLPLLSQLSQSLDAFPAIVIEKIDWKIAEELAPVPTGTASPAQAPVPPQTAGGPYAQAMVTAELPIGMASNHRGQLTLVNDFIKHLGTAPDTLVTVLQPPVDTQSGKTLKSGDEKRATEAPKFSFRLTRKL